MNIDDVRRQLKQLEVESQAKRAQMEAGEITAKAFNNFIDEAYTESLKLASLQDALTKANQIAGAQEAAMGGQTTLPSSFGAGAVTKSPSLDDLTDGQMAQLQWAADNRVPCRIEVKSGPGARSWLSAAQTKSAVTEAGLGGSFSGTLPPIMSPYAVSLPYEPVRFADYLQNVPMPGPSATWVTHTGNAAEVDGVAEAGTKGDIQPSLSVAQVTPQKLAGVFTMSWELWQDTEAYGQAQVASWLPNELMRSLTNAESLAVLGACTASSNPLGASYPKSYTFNGLMNTSSTLTRAVGDDSPLDALSKAYADLRTGAAFCEPDIVALHPNTLAALRREKDSSGRYIMDLLAGPSNLTAFGDQGLSPAAASNERSVIPQGRNGYSGTLWGASIVSTTHVPAGTALVMSQRAGGGLVWRRTGLILQFDMGLSGSNFVDNLYTWRAEERISVSVPRPTAINIVTELPEN